MSHEEFLLYVLIISLVFLQGKKCIKADKVSSANSYNLEMFTKTHKIPGSVSENQ